MKTVKAAKGKTKNRGSRQSVRATPPRPRDLGGLSLAFFGTFALWPSYHSGPPVEVARRLGAVIRKGVDEDLDYLVLGDRRGTGRADAKKKAEKLRARTKSPKGKELRPQILDEAAFREMVRLDVRGKRFAFFGGFDCCPAGFDDKLLTGMVEAVGGVVQPEVDDRLDYLVLGNRRGEGKIKAANRAEKMRAGGHQVQTLLETGFLELVRSEPSQKKTTDFAGFVSGLYGIVDQAKLGRALAMLRSETFKLYTHLGDDRLMGVVRSQTGSGTIYASWLTPEGLYGCSTPDLSNCMGLQGSPCKHLLVLLVGLVRTGQMDPDTALAWVHGTQTKRPRSDAEAVAETFIQYKGAEAGEIDWRPTETIPEDFYAF